MYKIIDFKDSISYSQGYEMQLAVHEQVKNNIYDGVLILLEHKPVFTIGANGGWDNLLCGKEYLESQGIDIVKISRGGNITFHGPGQLVAYPIFNLNHLKKDVHWYMDCLEDTVIRVLDAYDIKASKKPEYRGVWIEDRKIAAVGVHVKRWVTLHGLSFNINVDKKYFNMINPCGITEFGISSLQDYVDNPDITHIKEKLISCFEDVFQIEFKESDRI